MEDASIITVKIFGREYKIKGHAERNYIQSMAKYVDGKMRELSGGSSPSSQDRLAILAALNIADELFQERNRTSDTLSSVERRADQLITLLDEGLVAGK